jgi:hypothetical protein
VGVRHASVTLYVERHVRTVAGAETCETRRAVEGFVLYAAKEPAKFERAALRWLGRYVSEGKAVSLLKAQLALAALSELRAGSVRLLPSS